MRGTAWVLVSMAVFVAALLATLPVITWLGPALAPPAWDAHLVEMALWPIVWGALAIGGIWLAGRILMDVGPLEPVAVALAGVGFGLAAWQHVLLHQWARAHLGYYDADMIGVTAGLFAVLVGIGVAAFASHLAPRGVRWIPRSLVLIGALAVAFVGAGNAIAGAPGGIAADSVPLAVSIGVAVAYGLVASAVVTARALRRAWIDNCTGDSH